MHRGVYAVGRPELSRNGRWMAAVLACGPGTVLSHGSAAALWGIGRESRGIEVSVPGGREHRGVGARVHRRTRLGVAESTCRERLPVTDVALTLVDLGAWLTVLRLERAVNEADRLDLIDPEALRSALEAHRGLPGVARLRELLDRHAFRLTDSELERAFLPLVATAGLPPPETRRQVNGFRVDFFWPALGLVVETDGLRYHRTPAQQARDCRRDQAHVAAGLAQLRFSHAQVRHEPDGVVSTLASVARRLSAAP